jgi:hypothetical protein
MEIRCQCLTRSIRCNLEVKSGLIMVHVPGNTRALYFGVTDNDESLFKVGCPLPTPAVVDRRKINVQQQYVFLVRRMRS